MYANLCNFVSSSSFSVDNKSRALCESIKNTNYTEHAKNEEQNFLFIDWTANLLLFAVHLKITENSIGRWKIVENKEMIIWISLNGLKI